MKCSPLLLEVNAGKMSNQTVLTDNHDRAI